MFEFVKCEAIFNRKKKPDEGWFGDVEDNLCVFKQKIHNWMKDTEAERKAAVSSRLSNVSVGRTISKYSLR